MFTALLLPLLLAGSPPGAGVRATGGDDPAIQIWISSDRRFLPGDHAKVQVRAREDGYLLVLHADPDGHLRVLFPIDPKDDNFVRGGRKYEIRGRGGRESFTADDRPGRGTVYAAVSHDPFRFDEFVLSDHWDYRTLAPQRLAADPEPELNDVVRRMADGSFDYDVLTYDVIERVVYADSYGSSYYGDYAGAYDCGYSYSACHRSYYGSPFSVSVGLFFGRPYYHRRPYYDPFYSPFYSAAYDPFYDPFFYDPYYYRPAYVYPGRAYYSPYYNHGYYGDSWYNRNRGWDRPYTPYRFRPADGVNAGYRDRRYDLGRSVNTVYLPPKVRDRQPANATPGRRMTDQPASGTAVRPAPARRGSGSVGEAGTVRRSPDRAPERTPGRRAENRAVQPNIEARRAREPEERRTIVPDSRDARGRSDLPTEVRAPVRSDDTPRGAAARPEEIRGNDARREPVEARPARPARQDDGASSNDARGDGGNRGPTRAEPRPEPQRSEPRAEPRSEPRPEARPSDRGSDRGSYSPPPARSNEGSRGGSGGGDRGGGSGSGGGRRR
ncbi:MAG: DUF4384 domain-containing protein [Gemmatimonadales bacterium]